MWVLQLNNMRDNDDIYSPQACANTREEIIQYVKSQLAPYPYTETGLHRGNPEHVFKKVFKKGSPIEWFNYPEPRCFVDIGDEDSWAQNGRDEFRKLIAHMKSIGALISPKEKSPLILN